jgi:hypothetical protein
MERNKVITFRGKDSKWKKFTKQVEKSGKKVWEVLEELIDEYSRNHK